MPRAFSPAAIRAYLDTDRPWSVYALGDLAPGLSEHTEWHTSPVAAPALLMLFRAFATPVLFTIGASSAVEGLLDEISSEPRLYLSVREETLAPIQARYKIKNLTAMWRMTLDLARFSPVALACGRLSPADLPALERLFATGADAPDFFAPYMLAQGIYYGQYEGDALVAAAGTHVLVPTEGVAAIGNVYVRRDRRRRGLATQVTSAVAAELVQLSPALDVIALNVNQTNAAALRVYERLGFTRYCAFYEGVALV